MPIKTLPFISHRLPRVSRYVTQMRSAAWIAASLSLAAAAQAQTVSDSTSHDSVETLETVTVQASADASASGLSPVYAGGQVSQGSRVGILGNIDSMDSPFSSTQYTSQLIQDQQAGSVGDILQNDPAVRNARGYGNYQQVYMIRGFPLYSDDITYNGLYGLLPRQYLASEFIERLDVFRGASAFLNGAAPGNSGVGGSVNVVPKRAPNEPLSLATLGWESGNQGYASVDLARRFGPDDSTGIRINAARHAGGTAVEDEHRELNMLGLGLDWRGERVRLSADIGWQEHNLDRSQPSVTISPGLAIPDAPDSSNSLAPDFTYSNERDVFGTIRGEVDLTDKVTAWAAVGARSSKESSFLSSLTVLNSAGDMSVSSSTFGRKDLIKTGEIGLRAKFDTGGVGHTINASANYYNFESRNAYVFFSDAGTSNLYDPRYVAKPQVPWIAAGDLDNPYMQSSTTTASYAISDTLSLLNDRVLLTAGLRHQKIENKSYDAATGEYTPPRTSTSRTTPVAGVVFKATDEISLYANYIEGLTTIGPASGFPPPANLGETFEAVRTKQKEVGVKYDGGRFGGSLALFTTKQPLAYIDPTTNLYGPYGDQRNRGVELMMFGEPLRGLRLLGGVTWLDAEQMNTQAGVTDGNRVIGVPRTMANFGVEWDVPKVDGLTLTGRAVYTSSEYADAANTQKLPSWTRFDVGARYMTDVGGHLLTLRANVINVADKNYWASAGGFPGSGYLVLSTPRTFMLSATLEY
nr:TonB-dependent siderophore receptor [Allopusillimonas soli]